MTGFSWCLLLISYPVIVLGCSCPRNQYSRPACGDYEFSDEVYVARVINASCNCIPSPNDVDYFQNVSNISCASATLYRSGQFTNQVTVESTCDVLENVGGVLSCNTIKSIFQPNECAYEGQVLMDCAPLCHTTCSNYGRASPCPVVCVRGCGCPQGMVVDEDQRRCVMPSQCPNKNCSITGQIIRSCASYCPQDCFTPTDINCIQACRPDGCECERVDDLVDSITGRCVPREQCTACPVDGQEYTTCGSSCPRTCDNFNDMITCTTDCWQGCECPSGTVIDVENRRCVEPSQCGREMTRMVDRRVENERCTPRFVCPHNDNGGLDDYNVCQYAVEVMQVFKGTHQVGQIVMEAGPDLQSSCGYPRNILSVGTAYVAGIGGPCSFYSQWTAYSNFSQGDIERLNNNCSSAGLQLPSIVLVFALASVVIFNKFI